MNGFPKFSAITVTASISQAKPGSELFSGLQIAIATLLRSVSVSAWMIHSVLFSGADCYLPVLHGSGPNVPAVCFVVMLPRTSGTLSRPRYCGKSRSCRTPDKIPKSCRLAFVGLVPEHVIRVSKRGLFPVPSYKEREQGNNP